MERSVILRKEMKIWSRVSYSQRLVEKAVKWLVEDKVGKSEITITSSSVKP
jgi:hypothetical protein